MDDDETLVIPGFPLPDPTPVVVDMGGPVAGVMLAASGLVWIDDTVKSYALVAYDDGSMSWVNMTRVTAKYPPSGEYRLMFGWARKGPLGAPAWAETA